MKKIAVLLVAVFVMGAGTAYAATKSWKVVGERLTTTNGWYEKTQDEATGITCYSFQNKSAVSISCVKAK